MSTKTKNVQKQQQKAQVANPKSKPNPAPKTQVAPVVKKIQPASPKGVVRVGGVPPAADNKLTAAARAIENRIENKVARTPDKRIGVVEHGVPHRSGLRHGYLERTAVRVSKNGTTECYRGVERLGELRADPDTPPGQILDKVQLNGGAFGRVLPKYAKPFSKELFTKVSLQFVPEPALIKDTTEGSVYMGINFDPTAPLPVGDVGVDDVATWAPNDNLKALRDPGEMWVHAHLDLDSQIPLFIDNEAGRQDLQLISQGQMVFLSGTKLNAGGSESIEIGEWFIHFDVEFYQLNTSPGDVENGIMIGHVNEVATPIVDLSKFDQWVGDSEIIIAHDYVATAVTFSTPSPGTYIVEINETPAPGGGQIIADPVLAFYSTAGQADPINIKNCSLASDLIGVNHDTFTANLVHYTLNGVAALTAEWHKNDGSATFNSNAGSAARTTRFAFSAPQGTPFVLSTSTFNATCMVDLIIAKIDNVFHSDGNLTPRLTPNASLSLASLRAKEQVERKLQIAVCLTSGEMFNLLKYINDHRSELDPSMLNVLIDKCNLPIPKSPTTTMIAPALAAVASWAIATFGPILAEKACRWLERKVRGH